MDLENLSYSRLINKFACIYVYKYGGGSVHCANLKIASFVKDGFQVSATASVVRMEKALSLYFSRFFLSDLSEKDQQFSYTQYSELTWVLYESLCVRLKAPLEIF